MLLRTGDTRVAPLLFVDNAAVLGVSDHDIQRLLEQSGRGTAPASLTSWLSAGIILIAQSR